MAGEEELKALREIIKPREQVSPKELLDLVASTGTPKEWTKELRCKAFSSLMRSLLRDPGLDRLIHMLREREYVEAVVERLTDRMHGTGPLERIGDINVLNRFSAAHQTIEKEIKELRSSEVAKISLLKQTAEMLQTLECAEKFDLPAVEMRLPTADEHR